jgi:hypothetical protein
MMASEGKGAMSSTVQAAIEFVNLLVPGKFDLARARLSANCEYHYGGEVLRGDAIVRAFEESHESAIAKLDSVEYLPAALDSVVGDTVVVGTVDRIRSGDAVHTYRDRLAIDVTQGAIVRIEHRPYEEERRRLRAFFESAERVRSGK